MDATTITVLLYALPFLVGVYLLGRIFLLIDLSIKALKKYLAS